jgi:hypothetical protein
LKLLPNWGYTGTVGAFTPILITLGRIPYGNVLPAGNYALIRIEENLVGITVAIILTLIIFPVFAIDLLKDNIQSEWLYINNEHDLKPISVFLATLEVCRQSVNSMHLVYDQLFHHKHVHDEASIDLEEQEQEFKSFFNAQRKRFSQLISAQRTLVEQASLEPTLWWFNNAFSTSRYTILVRQQLGMFRMLHNIDSTVSEMNIFVCLVAFYLVDAHQGWFDHR